jgi:hypothetical protein
MPNTKDHYNVMLTKKLISFQDLKYPGLRRPDLPQISDKLRDLQKVWSSQARVL